MLLRFKGKVITDLDDKPRPDWIDVSNGDSDIPKIERVELTMERVVSTILSQAEALDPLECHELGRTIRKSGLVEVTTSQRKLIEQAVRTANLRDEARRPVFDADLKGQILKEIENQVEEAKKAKMTEDAAEEEPVGAAEDE